MFRGLVPDGRGDKGNVTDEPIRSGRNKVGLAEIRCLIYGIVFCPAIVLCEENNLLIIVVVRILSTVDRDLVSSFVANPYLPLAPSLFPTPSSFSSLP